MKLRNATPFAVASTLMCSVAHAQSTRVGHDLTPTPLGGASVWSHTAGSAKRNACPSVAALPALNAPAWSYTDRTTVPQTGLVADAERVFAITRDAGHNTHAIALDRDTGAELWATPVAPPILDSWSTPAIDTRNATLIVATGFILTALDSVTGEPAWSTELGQPIVNASPVVTADLGRRDRVLISTYSFGSANGAELVCLNTDPYHATLNPHQPGDIVWTLPLGEDSSGNSVAYQRGRAYLASAGDGFSQAGRVRCYDITADAAPAAPVWSFTNTIDAGFFGGVALARGHVYASSYRFSGLQTSANTVKLRKDTGALVWSTPTNRTDATPVVLPSGDVVVSSGVATGGFDFLPFYGSLPSVQYLEDRTDHAVLRWDSALSTLDDLNTNGVWDFGEPFLSIGGWTHQPIALSLNAVPHLAVGSLAPTMPGVPIAHNTDLRILDLTRAPTEPGFVVDHAQGTGGTPALASGWVFSAGPDAIRAYAPPSPLLSVRDLIDRFTRAELSIHELLERLPR